MKQTCPSAPQFLLQQKTLWIDTEVTKISEVCLEDLQVLAQMTKFNTIARTKCKKHTTISYDTSNSTFRTCAQKYTPKPQCLQCFSMFSLLADP